MDRKKHLPSLAEAFILWISSQSLTSPYSLARCSHRSKWTLIWGSSGYGFLKWTEFLDHPTVSLQIHMSVSSRVGPVSPTLYSWIMLSGVPILSLPLPVDILITSAIGPSPDQGWVKHRFASIDFSALIDFSAGETTPAPGCMVDGCRRPDIWVRRGATRVEPNGQQRAMPAWSFQ
jgi:hypothetical protein